MIEHEDSIASHRSRLWCILFVSLSLVKLPQVHLPPMHEEGDRFRQFAKVELKLHLVCLQKCGHLCEHGRRPLLCCQSLTANRSKPAQPLHCQSTVHTCSGSVPPPQVPCFREPGEEVESCPAPWPGEGELVRLSLFFKTFALGSDQSGCLSQILEQIFALKGTYRSTKEEHKVAPAKVSRINALHFAFEFGPDRFEHSPAKGFVSLADLVAKNPLWAKAPGVACPGKLFGDCADDLLQFGSAVHTRNRIPETKQELA